MLRYLHTTANSFTESLWDKMFKHGAYVLIPPAHAGNYFQAAVKGPYPRGFWKPGTGSVWSWQHKYHLFRPL